MAGVPGRSGGRNSKTTQEHDLAGTRRDDRHGEFDSPNPPKIKPDPPKELEGDARAEWDAMVGRLEASGTLTLVDDAAVYQYCRLYAETEQIALQQEEARESLRVLNDNISDVKEMSPADRLSFFGHIVQLEKLVSKCTDQLRSGRSAIRSYLVEFGMTPAARSRVKVPKNDTPTNKWDGLLPS
jgi:P27 family predicted phage terminase small subunit